MLATRDGSLWLTTLSHVYLLLSTSKRFEETQLSVKGRNTLVQDGNGRIWLTDQTSTRDITDGHPSATLAGTRFSMPPGATMDEEQGIWFAGALGLTRLSLSDTSVARGSVERWTTLDGLSSTEVRTVYADQEGSLWVGTSLGLDRYRRVNIIADNRVPATQAAGAILYRDKAGTIWIGGQTNVYKVKPGGRPEEVVHGLETQAICGDPAGAIWFVAIGKVVKLEPGRRATLPYPSVKGVGVFECAFDRRGQLWVTAGLDGLFRWTGHTWDNHPLPPGEIRKWPAEMIADRRGRLLINYREQGLTLIDWPERSLFGTTSPDNLGPVTTLNQGPSETLAAGKFGIARVEGAGTKVVRAARLGEWHDARDIIQTSAGDTWVIGTKLRRLSTAALDDAFAGKAGRIQRDSFDMLDGLPSAFNAGSSHDLAEGGDGRIWMVTGEGVAWLNPSLIRHDLSLPPVTIRGLIADGQQFRDPTGVRLRRGASNVEIDYTALTLAIPEHVRFRYKLEGFDRNWVDAGARRQAFYTNLPPGSYRFRVIAANEAGVWNFQGASLDITMPPTFFQSIWFKLLCIAVACLLLWVAFRIRVSFITSQLRDRLEARLAERERIARELHDTLLQGFQGLTLRFQAAMNSVPPESAARDKLEDALQRADQVLVEGRRKVRQLRVKPKDWSIADALADVVYDHSDGAGPEFSVTVDGQVRTLHPLVRDEVVAISCEAVRNALDHASAAKIDVRISYQRNGFRITVADDGVGIPSAVLAQGTEGHFGLIGMQERAARIRASLTVGNVSDHGIEVSLFVPAKMAYRVPTAKRLSAILDWDG